MNTKEKSLGAISGNNIRTSESITQKILCLIDEIQSNKHKYSFAEIDDIADSILEIYGLKNRACAIPIIRIVKDFDFKAYVENLEPNKSGDIHVNGDTKERYGHDKVILVNEKEVLQHQRFVLAHELAHYLFDFIGSPDYTDITVAFGEPYIKNQHETEKEKCANRFAASLLMPEDMFIKQYRYARSVSSNRLLTLRYLSKFFETTEESIAKRIAEVIR